MKRHVAWMCAVAAMMCATPALADHCDADLNNVDAAAAATTADQNAIVAAAALVTNAIVACDIETVQLASGELVLSGDNMTGGRALLINAAQLLTAK